jgi:acetyltransferase-like isoleucine patch superfamily enzyme
MNIYTRLHRLFYSRFAANRSLKFEPMSKDVLTLPGFHRDIRAGTQTDRISIGINSILGCKIILERNACSVKIGNDTYIGNSQIICAQQITIGSDVLISWGCTIIDHDSHSLSWIDRADDVKRWRNGFANGGLSAAATTKNWGIVSMAPIVICDKVWLGFNAIILKGITIGEGAVVAAGSVVTKDVPSWTLVGGNPARAIRELSKN